MTAATYTLTVLEDVLAICRLPPASPIPAWAGAGSFVSVTYTEDELSLVCAETQVPDGVPATHGWRCLKVAGPFALETTIGVLATLSAILAEAEVSIFVVSTYDTDYLLVKDAALPRALDALRRTGHTVLQSRTRG